MAKHAGSDLLSRAYKANDAAVRIKKDAKGPFWVVAKEARAGAGPYATKNEAADAKVALASGENVAPPAADVPATIAGSAMAETAAAKVKPKKTKEKSSVRSLPQLNSRPAQGRR